METFSYGCFEFGGINMKYGVNLENLYGDGLRKENGKKGNPFGGSSNSCGYWNEQPIKLPSYYNRNNIICQWLETHHTKRFRSDKGLRN